MGKYRRTLSVPTINPESPLPLLCALTTIWHLLFNGRDVIHSTESGNGEAAIDVRNLRLVPFRNSSTWKVSLGIFAALWPYQLPIPAVHKDFWTLTRMQRELEWLQPDLFLRYHFSTEESSLVQDEFLVKWTPRMLRLFCFDPLTPAVQPAMRAQLLPVAPH